MKSLILSSPNPYRNFFLHNHNPQRRLEELTARAAETREERREGGGEGGNQRDRRREGERRRGRGGQGEDNRGTRARRHKTGRTRRTRKPNHSHTSNSRRPTTTLVPGLEDAHPCSGKQGRRHPAHQGEPCVAEGPQASGRAQQVGPGSDIQGGALSQSPDAGGAETTTSGYRQLPLSKSAQRHGGEEEIRRD